MPLNKIRISVAAFVAAALLIAVGLRTGMPAGKTDPALTEAMPWPLLSMVRIESRDLSVKPTALGFDRLGSERAGTAGALPAASGPSDDASHLQGARNANV